MEIRFVWLKSLISTKAVPVWSNMWYTFQVEENPTLVLPEVMGSVYIIATLFVGCKHGGRSQNVSNNFDPFIFCPMGKVICMLDPSYVKNRAPEDLHLAGVESPQEIRHPVPPPNPPPRTLRIGGEVKIVKCQQAVCKLFVRCLCGDVINLRCLRSIVPFRKCSKKKVKLR